MEKSSNMYPGLAASPPGRPAYFPPADYSASTTTAAANSSQQKPLLDNPPHRNTENSWVNKSNFLDQVAAAAHEKYSVFTERSSYYPPAETTLVNPFLRPNAPTADFGAFPKGPHYERSNAQLEQQQQQPNGKPKRAALVGTPPAGAALYAAPPAHHHQQQGMPPAGAGAMGAYGQPAFGLGVGKYGNEIPSPLDAEIQHTILEMQQELAFIETQPTAPNLRHSKRLLKERCVKLEQTVDPDWVEVDINKPIKVTKRVLIPIFRHATFNYVGRILGPKGATLKNICKKFKCFISVMGSGSTKDRNRELELLNSNDPRFAHYASPLHIRIDTVAPAHIAHMRMAACLHVFHKLLIPGKEVYIEGISAPADRPAVTAANERAPAARFGEFDGKEEEELEQDFKYGTGETADEEPDFGESQESTSNTNGGGPMMRARGGLAGRARGGGFVPRGRGSNKQGTPY